MFSEIKLGLKTRFRILELGPTAHFGNLILVSWKYVFGTYICAEKTFSEIKFGVRQCVSRIKFESSEIKSGLLELNCDDFGNQM